MPTDFVGRILHNLTNLFYIINQNLSPKPSFLCTMYVEALYNKAVQDTYIHIIQTKTKQVQSIQCRYSKIFFRNVPIFKPNNLKCRKIIGLLSVCS